MEKSGTQWKIGSMRGKFLVVFVSVILGAVVVRTASANSSWVTTAGGTLDWNSPANWSGSFPPGLSDNVFITNDLGSAQFIANMGGASAVGATNTILSLVLSNGLGGTPVTVQQTPGVFLRLLNGFQIGRNGTLVITTNVVFGQNGSVSFNLRPGGGAGTLILSNVAANSGLDVFIVGLTPGGPTNAVSNAGTIQFKPSNEQITDINYGQTASFTNNALGTIVMNGTGTGAFVGVFSTRNIQFLNNGALFARNGTLRIDSRDSFSSGGFQNGATGSIEVDSNGVFELRRTTNAWVKGPTMTNFGTVFMNGGSVIPIDLSQTGSVLGTNSTQVIANFGTLHGNGTINASVNSLSGSVIAPGLGFQRLTIAGSVSLGNNATLSIELGSLTGQNDLLAIGSTLSLNANNVLNLSGGAVGNVYTVVTALAVSGVFGTVTTNYLVNYSPTAIMVIPEPSMGPLVNITSPANNANYTPGSSIIISANASEAGGSISNVAFYANSVPIGNATNAPYSFTWTSVPAGSYALTAEATDATGASITSRVVNVTVSVPFVASQIKTVFVIPLENHDWQQACPTCSPQQLLGNPAAPYVNSLITPGNSNAVQVSYATKYYSVAQGEHPSEPNYVWSEAGTEFGVHTDNDPSTSSGNLFGTPSHLCRQLTDAGISWKSYQEDLEYTTSPAISASGTRPSGTNSYNGSQLYGYAVKHNPMEFFTDTQNTNVFTLAQFWTDLSSNTVGRYNWITPNLYNEMHSSLPGYTYHGFQYSGDQAAIAEGDNCLSIIIPKIMASTAYQDHGAIIIWTDETESTDDTNSTLTYIIISPLAKGNAYASNTVLSHSSDLKTMDEIFGLAFQTNAIVTASIDAQGMGYNYVDGRSATVNDLGDLFQECAPLFVSQPTSLTNNAGTNVCFSVDAMACAPLSYQWYFGTNVVAGETNSTLCLASVGPANVGNYHVDVTSGDVVTESGLATLTVIYQTPNIVGGQMILGAGGFQLTFSGPSGQTYEVLASDDMTVPQSAWTVIGSGMFGSANVIFTDTDAINHTDRFYIIKSP